MKMRSIILVHNASLWRHTDDIKLSFHFWLYFNRAHDFIGIGAADFCCGDTSIPNEYQNRLNPKIPDCESADVELGDTVIERYFVRSSSTTGQGLLLACDAGRVTTAGITGLSANYQSGGSEVILGVDQFKILLGIQTDAPSNAGLMRYLTASEYLALSGTKPPITAVKIGLIVRGSSPVIGSDVATSFKLLGATQPLKSGQPKLVRTTYESTTLLRNARVINIDTSTTLTAGS